MLFIIIQLILRVIHLRDFYFTVNSEIMLLELYLKCMKQRFSVQFQEELYESNKSSYNLVMALSNK